MKALLWVAFAIYGLGVITLLGLGKLVARDTKLKDPDWRMWSARALLWPVTVYQHKRK
jgi:hypothetical protein